MEIFTYISGAASIIALFISIYQVLRVTRVKDDIDKALNDFKERKKRESFQAWLSKSRDLTRELTSIANKVANRKYRGGQGRELKNRIEIYLGDLDEFVSDLPNEVFGSLKSIKDKIKHINFEEIENNPQVATDIKEDFQNIRNRLSEYLRG